MIPGAFRQRRHHVLQELGPEAAMILPAAPEIVVRGDNELRYIPDAELWYLTGYEEPEAVALLAPGTKHPFTLFVRPRDPDRETWTGPRGGVAAALEQFGADAAYPITELTERLPQLLKGIDRLYFRPGAGRPELDRLVVDTLQAGRQGRQRTGHGLAELADPGLLLDEMRLIKDPGEVQAIREAVELTMLGLRQGIARARDGAGEWEVEAAVDAAFRSAGGHGAAFATIAASGPNACVLHHIANDRVMHQGELLLIDAGARLRGYNGDLTRTVPVDGRFTGAQEEVYDIVLAANRAAINAVRPGATADDVHHAAAAILARGMVDLGLLAGDPDEIVSDPATLKRYYPHRTSHWLGLDVHDVGTYAVQGDPRHLRPGMVLTIEPGLYIPAHDHTAPEHLRGIGVRIEDDVLVTLDSVDVLSREMPVEPAEIAALTAS